jgi:hypothetical protein
MDIDFHTLQMIRKTCTVWIWRYLWEAWKHAIAQDEMMDLINCWHSLFPMPCTMNGFVRESTQVLSVVCQLFILFIKEAHQLNAFGRRLVPV